MMSAAMIRVTHAAAGMTVLPSSSREGPSPEGPSPEGCLAQKLGHRARIADGADRYFADRGVCRGKPLRHAVELADQRHPAGHDVVTGMPDAPYRDEHPGQHEDDAEQ